jgi:hypothetical protein
VGDSHFLQFVDLPRFDFQSLRNLLTLAGLDHQESLAVR